MSDSKTLTTSTGTRRLVMRLVAAGRPLGEFVSLLQRIIDRLMVNPYMADMIRFFFLGTVMDAGQRLGEYVIGHFTHYFVTKATFTQGDFAYDWISDYLHYHKFWGQSREFRVVARDVERLRNIQGRSSVILDKADLVDGRPAPAYEPSPETPELFYWRGHWMSVAKTAGTHHDYETGAELGGTMTVTCYSWSRRILQDLVHEAREHYHKSGKPPRLVEPKYDPSGCTLTAHFNSGDASYNWILSLLMTKDLLKHATEVNVTTKQYATAWNPSESSDEAGRVRFMPPDDTRQLFNWNGNWIQTTVRPPPSYSRSTEGGKITIVLYNSKQSVLLDLIEAARQHYLEKAATKMVVHITDSYYNWNKTITKSQRHLDTLILPEGVKERLLSDVREFLVSEQWYGMTGVPHRRGYLLHGEPGTGKSSTIHALAGELGLEVYFMSLAAPEMNDSSLAALFSDAPSHSIILLEDIDCAFPSRDPDEDSDDEDDLEEGETAEEEKKSKGKAKGAQNEIKARGGGGGNGGERGKGKEGGGGDSNEKRDRGKSRRPRPMIPPRSSVTLAGLLNVLDGVTSEEGRIVFATTNHIENLDPALIRPGRMDVKVQYNLATKAQIEQTFLRFYPVGGHVFTDTQASSTSLTNPKLVESAERQNSLPLPSLPASSAALIQIAENKSRRDHHGLSSASLSSLSSQFSAAVPESTYSIAQLQGYLLTRKNNPVAAVEDVGEWLEEQRREKEHIAGVRRERRIEARRRRREEEAEMRAAYAAMDESRPGMSTTPAEGEEGTDEEEDVAEVTRVEEASKAAEPEKSAETTLVSSPVPEPAKLPELEVSS